MTPKQERIYLELIQGKTYQQIAKELYISKETVKSHSRAIYKQYGVANCKELMALLLQQKPI